MTFAASCRRHTCLRDTGHGPLGRELSGAQAWLRLADLSIFAAIVCSTFPETLWEPEVAGLPLEQPLFLLAILSVVAAVLSHPRTTLRLPIVVVVLAGIYMAAVGLVRSAETKFFVADLLKYGVFVLALCWIELRPAARSIERLYRYFAVAGVALAVNVAGLALGLIPATDYGPRRFTYGLFHANEIVLGLLPLVLVHLPALAERRSSGRSRALIVALTFIPVFGAFVSGTRSVLVVWAVSAGLMIWLTLTGRRAVAALLVVAVTAALGNAVLVDDMQWDSSTLVTRLTQTNLESEPRIEEVRLMWDDLEGDLVGGKGFGSRFPSCIGQSGDLLVLAPHIGILTLLLKGGLVVWTLIVVIPLLLAAWSVFCRQGIGNGIRGKPVQCAAWCPWLVYVMQSSVSGGWGLEALFVAGVSIALAGRIAREARAACPSRRRQNHCGRAATRRDNLFSAHPRSV